MAYATQTDLENRVGGPDRLAVLLADNQGMELAGRLAAAIADAEAEIDSALEAFYAVPFSAVPAIVTRWAADLALGALVGDRSGTGPIAARALEAKNQLAEVRAARRSIPGVARKDGTGGSDDPDPTFTRGEDQVDGNGGTMDVW